MRAYKIYLIRHGKTEANISGEYIGRTDLDLCPEGISEIVSLKTNFDYPNVGKVYTSPLKRCIQTSRLIFKDMTPFCVDNLTEYNFGEFEGKNINELQNNKVYQEWIRGNSEILPLGAESMVNFRHRIVDGMHQIILDMMQNKISESAVFTHGGVIKSILSLCGLPKKNPYEWSVDYAQGYTLMISASLWGNTKSFEVFTPVPFGTKMNEVDISYQNI